MPDSNRRSKMISVRVSDSEYTALKGEYRSHGARSISDLARAALQKILAASAPQHEISRKVADLAARVQQLEAQVASILERARADI